MRQRKPVQHGTRNGYIYHGCRCEECRKSNTEGMAAYRLKPSEEKNLTHGRESSYSAGCHCVACTGAHAVYTSTKNRRKRDLIRRETAVPK